MIRKRTDKLTSSLRIQISALPHGPGVYLFLDKSGQVLYLGKSVNLKKRVSSYFYGDLSQRETRLQRLIYTVHELKHYSCSGELPALLLEDVLIKYYNPDFNIQQNKFRRYQYLRLTDDPYPRLVSLEHPVPYAGALFGPFPDGFFVQRLEVFLGRYFGLRNCSDVHPTKGCLQADLGLCLAPCIDQIGRDQYVPMIQLIGEFMQGESNNINNKIKAQLDHALEHEQFEIASRCQKDLIFAGDFLQRQKFTAQFETMELRIEELAGEDILYQFKFGNLKAINKSKTIMEGDQLLLEFSTITDKRFLLDRAHLILAWLKRNRDTHAYHFSIK
ncbi:MAG: GIY-YIG nuclease family protein [Candidatus Marinimicrobia bacterium]|nr:GIY-YIG nuclease family protein [Candidatus Neomarinimicrobiota bacterium]